MYLEKLKTSLYSLWRVASKVIFCVPPYLITMEWGACRSYMYVSHSVFCSYNKLTNNTFYYDFFSSINGGAQGKLHFIVFSYKKNYSGSSQHDKLKSSPRADPSHHSPNQGLV